jgi:hypothetical protein
MFMNSLGKILFPRLDREQGRREVKTILIALLVGLVFAIIVGLVMILKNSPYK